ncbi:MAG: LytTR family transcriptional regulator, partial [Erysipelotrichia bacterium]|nr:LytTR family transcriptional regulator [Erysipelotrichia bacterium]
SKSLIVNITKISAVKSAFNGKLTITLSDKKELEVNRSYVKAFKNYLKGR